MRAISVLVIHLGLLAKGYLDAQASRGTLKISQDIRILRDMFELLIDEIGVILRNRSDNI